MSERFNSTRFFMAHLKIHHRFLVGRFLYDDSGELALFVFLQSSWCPLRSAGWPSSRQRKQESGVLCMRDVNGSGLQVCVLYYFNHLPLVRTESYGHTQPQESLGNGVLCVGGKKKKRNRCYWAEAASILTFSPSGLNLILKAVVSHPPP